MLSSPSAVSSLLSGSLFGSALLLSGVYSPAIITSQLALTNFHMLEAFLSASAVSALVVLVADKTGWSAIQIRDPRKLSFSSIPYSGNVLGGSLLGLGMGLTGACPGTVLVQIAAGVGSGRWVAVGGVLAGVLWSVVKPHVLSMGVSDTGVSSAAALGGKTNKQANTSNANANVNVKVRPGSPAHTLQATLHLSTDSVLLIYETMCLAMILASLTLAPRSLSSSSSFLPPAIGGLFIGLAQAATLLLTRKTVGVSGAYGDIGNYLTSLVRGKDTNTAKLFSPSVLFAAGILAGSAALASWRPEVLVVGGGLRSPQPGRAFWGGVASILGASLAGGCTSGHGISGMATFSTASFVTVAAMFGGGIATVMVLG